MRDRRFVAVHRGGPLTKQKHRMLARWAAACAERVLKKTWAAPDLRPWDAVHLARAWAKGEIPTGMAQQAALAAHAAARKQKDPAHVAAARAAGHAAATAHAADHSLAAAGYALRAARLAGLDPAAERAWQDAKLPAAVRDLVRSARASRRMID